jgi:hypothetical protein
MAAFKPMAKGRGNRLASSRVAAHACHGKKLLIRVVVEDKLSNFGRAKGTVLFFFGRHNLYW